MEIKERDSKRGEEIKIKYNKNLKKIPGKTGLSHFAIIC
jgi:hypothetical protein